ncbi:MAG: RagB/SusD family nutrient uptake outer membrane protein [Bacteroidales bacterium]|jgi:hypothetical protein|nr:RagB/SusD family nutrient uptake outer membrane protein [Bacteroidales bacterium]
MKKILSIFFAAATVLTLASCDKLFDNLEGDLTKMYKKDLIASTAGVDRVLANLYSAIPMDNFAEREKNTPHAGDSSGDTSYGITAGNMGGGLSYTTIRNINSFFELIEEAKTSGTIKDDEYNYYKGEAYFVRAYYYFGAVRRYGGVAIVTEVLDDKYVSDDDFEGLFVNRSTEVDTWKFILTQLDEAAKLLPDVHPGGAYRATKWAALGLKSRVALWAASLCKYWDQAELKTKPSGSNYKAYDEKLAYMDKADAKFFYDECIKASEAIINSGRFSLYGAQPKSVDEAVKNYTDLFQSRHDEEWIYGRSYNNGVATNSNGFDIKNSPNQIHGAGTGVWRFGCYGVTLDMVDLYDYYDDAFGAVDGTVPTLKSGEIFFAQPHNPVGNTAIKAVADDFIVYDKITGPFEKKDARFLASVIYPGINFRGTDIVIQAGMWQADGTLDILNDKNPKATVGGTDYFAYGASSESYYSGFYKRGNTNDGSWYTTGFGIRKFLAPDGPVDYPQYPWYDIRYTEILLNYCEAEVEQYGDNAGNSKQYLNAIRRRAYFLDQRDATIETVLHEREVEMAFEEDYPRMLHRRRAYFNEARDLAANPNGGRKHALLPILDLRDGTPKYVFIRANWWAHDTDRRPGLFSFNPGGYYDGIPNYTKNKITPNPSQDN